MPNPKFNRAIKDRSSLNLPIAFVRPEDPVLGAAMFSALLANGEAVMDEGLLHGRSDVEKGIKWKAKPEEIPDAIHYRVAWIAIKGTGPDALYSGVTISEFDIDRPQRLGAKDFPAQVNAMSRALQGKVEIDSLPEDLRNSLGDLLRDKGATAWGNSSDAFHQAFN